MCGSEQVQISVLFGEMNNSLEIGYSTFFSSVKKFDEMRLVNLSHENNRGRKTVVTLRYDPEKVIETSGGEMGQDPERRRREVHMIISFYLHARQRRVIYKTVR